MSKVRCEYCCIEYVAGTTHECPPLSAEEQRVIEEEIESTLFDMGVGLEDPPNSS